MIITLCRQLGIPARFQVRKIDQIGDTWLAELTLLMNDGAQAGARIRTDKSVAEHLSTLVENQTITSCSIITIPCQNADEELVIGFKSLQIDNPLSQTPHQLEFELDNDF